jgi:hypothetical protein
MHPGSILVDQGRTPSGGVKTHMRLIFLLVAAMLASVSAVAQPSQASPPASPAQDAPSLALPVSVDRIRELLARAPAESVLLGLDRQPDYKITVEERRFLKDILESLDVKTGPAPPGGLYAYEIQQQVWNTRNSPLVRPYAAFTSGELAQVSLTSILGALVTRYLTHGVMNLSRTEAENLAREDVRRAIDEYCNGRPDRSFIEICTSPTLR